MKTYQDYKILVDIDNVLNNLTEHLCDWLEKEYGFGVKATDIKSWNLKDYYPSLSPKEIFAPLQEKEFWETIAVNWEGVGFIKKLQEEGFSVYLCSASHYSELSAKIPFIHDNFPFIKWENVIITANKQMVKGDFLVDDGIHNLINGDYHKILFTCPHNESFDAEKADMYRANNWQEVYNHIKDVVDKEIEVEQSLASDYVKFAQESFFDNDEFGW